MRFCINRNTHFIFSFLCQIDNNVPSIWRFCPLSSGTQHNNFLQIEEDVYITCNGRIVVGDEVLESGKIYRICPRLMGGKGGMC